MSTHVKTSPVGDLRAQVDSVRRWYHTIEVAPGLVTPGLFDLRPIVSRLPWPELTGKRCLDVGTSDGFLAFELERRGAAEVVAADIASHEAWDWEVRVGELGPEYLRHVSGPRMGAGFELARVLRNSAVISRHLGVYELSPERVGQFDVVVCGSLLLHLQDPLRALRAIRSVCRGQLLCTNQIDLARSLTAPHRPLMRLDGTSGITQWWLPNVAGHRQMLRASGFELIDQSRPYCIPYGIAHPRPSRRPRSLARSLGLRWLTGNDGVPHHAVLARPV